MCNFWYSIFVITTNDLVITANVQMSTKCWSITNSNVVKTYQNWGDEFKICFSITVLKNDYYDIFHFSAGGGGVAYGDRIPWVGVYYSQILIDSAVNGYLRTGFDYVLGKQHQITIQQFKDGDGKYQYEVIVDGVSKVKIENTQAESFSNVKLYAGSPWHGSQFSSDAGSICDVKITPSEEEG